MNTLEMPPGGFRALAVTAFANGRTLRDLTDVFDEFARTLAHPAALLDAGLVFLALNGPYARMVGLPPSALVGKDYAKIHRNRQDILDILHAGMRDEPHFAELPEPLGAVEGQRYQTRSITPLRNADAQVLGMVLQYHHDPAPRFGAED